MAAPHATGIPGMVALLGSGETTGTGRRVLGGILRLLDEPRAIAVLDSPAGFQPNHQRVAGKVADFITEKLGEFHPRPQVVETRQAQVGNPAGDAALQAIAHARCIVAGPGSPTYMVRELAGSPYLAAVRQAHRNGAAIFVSSAASLAVSAYTLPVYEIFKVGADPFWVEGLDLLGPFGMKLAIVPHWNNSEGGAELDTRFSYTGQQRFEQLRAQLPEDAVILGIDEHSACLLDFATQQATVDGKGGAHIIRGDQLVEFGNGETFPLTLLGADTAELDRLRANLHFAPLPADAHIPDPTAILDPRIEENGVAGHIPTPLIDALLGIRTGLRGAKQWSLADQLRDALLAVGIIVEDTPQGSQWHVAEDD